MSRYEDSDRYDFSRLLDWKKAQVQQGDASGLQPDETYTLNWVIPYGSQEQARNWIYANRQGFQGPEIPFMQLDGFWRTLQVRYQVVDPKNSNAGVNIQHIIAKGYYTSIDWDTARILSEDSSASNDSSAGIPNSESAQEQKFLQVRFPFIAPESVSSIVGSVSVPSPVTIRGNTYTGLNKILEAARLEEDGSYSVLVTLADPQYTLESYSDAGGTNQQDIVYLWDVPKDLAQTLIDNWKSTNPVGASASADYNDSQKLVNIVLRKNSLVKPNLTLAGINVACDTTQNFHFAWGYQKEDIKAFIDAHNSPTETGTRQVQVQTRADGLYDITIIETVVSADNPPHFDIKLGVGDKITNTQKYGWNISKSQLSSIKSAYETQVVGETKSFRVTRQDDCTFDYEGSIAKQLKQSAEVTIAGTGITSKAKTIRGATDTDAGYEAGPRKRHRVDVRKEDDGTNTITVSEEETTEGSLQTLSSGANGVSVESGSFNSTDALPDIPQSAKRVQVRPELRINDDGTYTGGYTQTSVQIGEGSGSITGNGITVKTRSKTNADNVDTTYTANKRERVSLSIQPNDDGTVNFTESQQTVVANTQNSVGSGVGVVDVAAAYSNLDSPVVPPKSGKRYRVRPRLQANDDGTWSGGYESTSVSVGRGSGTISGEGVNVKVAAQTNADAVSTSYSTRKRDRASLSIQPNDDGTVNYTETIQTVQQSTGSGNITGNGIKVSVRATANADQVTTTFTANKRDRVSLSISPNDDGSVSYVESKQTVAQVTAKESVISGSEGILVKSKAAKNLDDPPSNLYQSGKRKRHNISLSANDDGTWDAVATEQVLKEVDGDTIDVALGSNYGIRSKVKIYKNTNILNHGLQGGPRKRHSISASANDDDTIDYIIQETEVKETTQSSMVGSASQSKKIYFAENIQPQSQISIPGIITNQVINVKDDGTIGYVAVTKDTASPTAANHTYESYGSTTEINTKTGTNVDDLPSLQGSAEGEECEISLRPDDDGSLAWTAVKTTWKPLDQSAKGGTSLFKEVVEIGQNKKASEANSVIDLEAQDGEQIRVSAQIDERSGKVAYVKSTITANSSGQWEDTEENNFILKTITQELNADAPATLGVGEVGRTQSRINEYKKYDTIKEVLQVSENLSTFTESLAYQKKERRYMFTERTLSGDAKGWKELSSGEIRQKSTNRQWLFFGIHYVERTIDTKETIEYSINPLNAGSSANAPEEGEQQVTVEILPNGLYVKKTTTVTISQWESEPTQVRRVNYVSGTGSEVVQKIEDDGETIKLEFGTTTVLGGTVEP